MHQDEGGKAEIPLAALQCTLNVSYRWKVGATA